jgi:hypothetical protein
MVKLRQAINAKSQHILALQKELTECPLPLCITGNKRFAWNYGGKPFKKQKSL